MSTASIPDFTPGQVRVACDAFTGALDAVDAGFAAYREMVERFRETGTFAVDDETRAKIEAAMPSDPAMATLDALDALAVGFLKLPHVRTIRRIAGDPR